MHHLETQTELLTDQRFDSQFAKDVYEGLSASNKWLSSKYFYDEKGDQIFRQIMAMDSYYLTRSEHSIFTQHKEAIRQAIANSEEQLAIYELGAGDGLKTEVLLSHFASCGTDFVYNPIDISGHVLQLLKGKLERSIPDINMNLLEGDYFERLADIKDHESETSLVMFLGSNIGNFSFENAKSFLRNIRNNLKPGDLLMVGIDLKKSPSLILEAYGDKEGITASFNLNLLERMNRELGARFDLDSFKHHPVYDPLTGECRSYLLSLKDQTVYIELFDQEFEFNEWEPVFTEISRKYNQVEIDELARATGFAPAHIFTDEKGYFVDVVWKAI